MTTDKKKKQDDSEVDATKAMLGQLGTLSTVGNLVMTGLMMSQGQGPDKLAMAQTQGKASTMMKKGGRVMTDVVAEGGEIHDGAMGAKELKGPSHKGGGIGLEDAMEGDFIFPKGEHAKRKKKRDAYRKSLDKLEDIYGKGDPFSRNARNRGMTNILKDEVAQKIEIFLQKQDAEGGIVDEFPENGEGQQSMKKGGYVKDKYALGGYARNPEEEEMERIRLGLPPGTMSVEANRTNNDPSLILEGRRTEGAGLVGKPGSGRIGLSTGTTRLGDLVSDAEVVPPETELDDQLYDSDKFTKKEGTDPYGPGFALGTKSAALGAAGPLAATIAQAFANDPYEDPYANYGDEAIETMDDSLRSVEAGYRRSLSDVNLGTNAARKSIQEGATGAGTSRANELELAAGHRKGVMNLRQMADEKMSQLLSQKAGFQLQQSGGKAQGKQIVQDVEEHRKDATFSAVADNLANAATMGMTVGRQMNESVASIDQINGMLSAAGLTVVRDEITGKLRVKGLSYNG